MPSRQPNVGRLDQCRHTLASAHPASGAFAGVPSGLARRVAEAEPRLVESLSSSVSVKVHLQYGV